MRIYGSGILKTRSTEFKNSGVGYAWNSEAKRYEVTKTIKGPNGERVEMYFTQEEAQALINDFKERLQAIKETVERQALTASGSRHMNAGKVKP